MATTRTASKAKPATTRSRRPSGPAELLLEIGTEELPHQFVAPALTALQELTQQFLQEQRLTHGSIRTLGTPRRLVVYVDQLAEQQTAAVKEAMGPSKAVAFDKDGQPTKAAIGFATGQGVPVGKLEIRTTPKGEYVFAVKQEPGQPAAAVLAEHLPRLIGRLSFPKAMQWNDTGVRFARPIRWLVALAHGNVLPIAYAGVTAGSVSYGHRFIARDRATATKGFAVRTMAQYLQEAERQGVIVDPDRRRTMIVAQLAELAKSVGGLQHPDDELVEQAVYAVEYPQAVLGSFESRYLALPKEVLMTSMKEHQGFFALVDRQGALLPNFLAIANMKLPDMRLIREGNERVLAARLADAKFFYEEDRKVPLADKADRLAQVLFLQNCGTLRDKTTRMSSLAAFIADRLGALDLKDVSSRAAWLSKVDLISGIVGEFPSLQGIMGGDYAKQDGEPREVWEAIREHYLPKGMEGDIPSTLPGRILSLADRLDTITLLFYIGRSPSGSEDPFALRRHALGIVRILVEGELNLDLTACIDRMWDRYKQDLPGAVPRSSGSEVLAFIGERVRFYGRTAHQMREDILDAVLRGVDQAGANLTDRFKRARVLQAISTRPEFDPLIVGFKRAHRLSEKEQWDRGPVDSSRFGHQAERDLYQALEVARSEFATLMPQGAYDRAVDVLVRMKEPIDAFFAGVMVNDQDPAVRANRLSLLKDVDDLFLAFADFSQIMVQGS